MHIKNNRALMQGILILVFAATAYWVNLNIGLVLVALMGLMILQSAFTDWCPSDLCLRPVSLKKKLESKK